MHGDTISALIQMLQPGTCYEFPIVLLLLRRGLPALVGSALQPLLLL